MDRTNLDKALDEWNSFKNQRSIHELASIKNYKGANVYNEIRKNQKR